MHCISKNTAIVRVAQITTNLRSTSHRDRNKRILHPQFLPTSKLAETSHTKLYQNLANIKIYLTFTKLRLKGTTDIQSNGVCKFKQSQIVDNNRDSPILFYREIPQCPWRIGMRQKDLI